MQSRDELMFILVRDRPDAPIETLELYAHYLLQLKGCKLFSAIKQDVNPAGWLKARTNGIGGSDIATIMNENPWSSPQRIWMSKLNMFDDDKKPTQSEAARWGNLLEDAIAKEWGVRHNRQWIHIPVTLQSEEHPWMLANIDGFTLTDDRAFIIGILEIKTTSAYNEEPWAEGPLPLYYMYQTNWYCGITQLGQYDIVCLVGGQKMYDYQLPADPELFARQTEAAKHFWLVNIMQGVEPELTAGDLEAQQQKERDIEIEPAIFADEESINVVEGYIKLRENITALGKVKDALGAQLYALLGNGTVGVVGERTVSVSTASKRKVDWKRLEKEFPVAYEHCVELGVSSRLNVK